MKRIQWIKGKDNEFWTYSKNCRELYCIFNTENKQTKYAIGIYRNIRFKRDGTLAGGKPLFYDGFSFRKAKRIVREIIKLNTEKIPR